MSLADELRRLQELHAGGALTDEEYAQAKARVINGPPAPSKEPPRPPRRSPERREPERPAPEPAERPAQDGPRSLSGKDFIPLALVGLVIVAFVLVFAAVRFGQGVFGNTRGDTLTLKVDRVESSPDGFRVHMTATNHTKDTLRWRCSATSSSPTTWATSTRPTRSPRPSPRTWPPARRCRATRSWRSRCTRTRSG